MAGSPDHVARHIRKLATTEGGVHCAVCGQNLSGQVFACAQCETPYHPDCWNYQGGCSVYGCREAPVRPEAVAVEVVIGDATRSGRSPSVRSGVALTVIGLLGLALGLSVRWWSVGSGVRPPSPRHPSLAPASAPDPDPSSPDPGPLAHAPSIEEFMEFSKGAEWEGKVFFLRSLVTTRDPRALTYLLGGLHADDEIGNVREAAAETLGRAGWTRAIPALEEQLARETVTQVKTAIVVALYWLGSPKAVKTMREWIDQCAFDHQSRDGTLVGEAARQARLAGDRNALAAAGAMAVADAGVKDLRPAVERLLTARDSWVVGVACHSLGKLGDEAAIPSIARLLSHNDESLVSNAAEALLDLGAADRWPEIERALARGEHGSSYLPHLRSRLAKLTGGSSR